MSESSPSRRPSRNRSRSSSNSDSESDFRIASGISVINSILLVLGRRLELPESIRGRADKAKSMGLDLSILDDAKDSIPADAIHKRIRKMSPPVAVIFSAHGLFHQDSHYVELESSDSEESFEVEGSPVLPPSGTYRLVDVVERMSANGAELIVVFACHVEKSKADIEKSKALQSRLVDIFLLGEERSSVDLNYRDMDTVLAHLVKSKAANRSFEGRELLACLFRKSPQSISWLRPGPKLQFAFSAAPVCMQDNPVRSRIQTLVGASLDFDGVDQSGLTSKEKKTYALSLLLALSVKGDVQAVKNLLETSSIAKKQINTALVALNALRWAVAHGNIDLIRLLLKHGADTDLTDDRGESVIYSAVRRNQLQVIELLGKKLGDRAPARNALGQTLLMVAVQCGLNSVVQAVLTHCKMPELDAVDIQSRNAQHFAKKLPSKQIWKMLDERERRMRHVQQNRRSAPF